jgi:hypothetical protein
LTAALLVGCTTSTGILPAGPNTYTITEGFAGIRGEGSEAERDVLTKANQYCAQQGRQFVPNNMGRVGETSNGYTATFRCLSPNDPVVTNYHLGQAPNLVIEQRNR